MMFFLKKIPFLNQIKLIFVYLMEKIPRLSQTQRWFTEHYPVDSVTATDMRNLNKVKKILRFEFSIYIWIGRQSFYRPFKGVESYEPGCAACDQRTFSPGSIVSRHDAGCRRWRQTAYDLRLLPRTQLSESHSAGSRRASVFPITSSDETCPLQKRSPTSAEFGGYVTKFSRTFPEKKSHFHDQVFLILTLSFQILCVFIVSNVIYDPFFTTKALFQQNNSLTTPTCIFSSLQAFASIPQHYFSK